MPRYSQSERNAGEGSLSTTTLTISVPQAFLKYQSANWDPPSRWDEGIPGLLFDYNLTSQAVLPHRQVNSEPDGTGVAGANLGPWRCVPDWQGRRDSLDGTTRSPSTGPVITPDAHFLKLVPGWWSGRTIWSSDIFDSFRFAGFSLITDDNMLPPNLRGYAPEITGVARTNARVVVMHQGRVLYQTQVAAGPFRIQDIDDSVLGELHVRVEEEDGPVQTFTLNTAAVPYLTRPGQCVTRWRWVAR